MNHLAPQKINKTSNYANNSEDRKRKFTKFAGKQLQQPGDNQLLR
jgi:hypothetical protein